MDTYIEAMRNKRDLDRKIKIIEKEERYIIESIRARQRVIERGVLVSKLTLIITIIVIHPLDTSLLPV